MHPHNRAMHMREHLKQIYRARLPDIGWCDDNTRRKQQVGLTTAECLQVLLPYYPAWRSRYAALRIECFRIPVCWHLRSCAPISRNMGLPVVSASISALGAAWQFGGRCLLKMGLLTLRRLSLSTVKCVATGRQRPISTSQLQQQLSRHPPQTTSTKR